jgi:ubiquinone/menaquinone biosynthesis C-methylase UbiE
LASGSGVLDIAGGKGELAFEFVNLNNIPATVVEPRLLKLAKQELWLKVYSLLQ